MNPALAYRPTWVNATFGLIRSETQSARSLSLEIPAWAGHIAGQHVDVRLTAADGYQAVRSYSISSGPEEAPQITVERFDDGEVSPYLVDVAQPGDQVEVRGPLGGYFIWESVARPLLLVGGGSGVAPLRSMWRAGSAGSHLLYSARSEDRVIYRSEIVDSEELESVVHLTREDRPGYRHGRIDSEALGDVLMGLDDPAVFACGPTAFVESVAGDLKTLLGSDYPIKTERFG